MNLTGWYKFNDTFIKVFDRGGDSVRIDSIEGRFYESYTVHFDKQDKKWMWKQDLAKWKRLTNEEALAYAI